MQDLPAWGCQAVAGRHVLPVFEIGLSKATVVFHIIRGRHVLKRRVNVIGCPVGFVPTSRERANLAKQLGRTQGNRTQRFKVRSSGRLHVETTASRSRQGWEDRKFVGSGMQTELIRT